MAGADCVRGADLAESVRVVPLVVEIAPQAGATASVRLFGDLDSLTSPQLRREMDCVIAAGCTHIDFDVQSLEFLDASGLTALLEIQHALGGPGHVALRQPRTIVTTLLTITGLLHLAA